MAPACDTVAFMTSAAAFAFVLLPLAFLLAMVVMYLEVNTLYHLAKRHASAGGYYGYVATAFGPKAAIVVGLIYPLYQIVSTAAIPIYVAGVLLPGILNYFWGIQLPGWIWIPFIAIFVLAPIGLAMVGIRPQMKYIRYAAITELIFLAITSLIIILKAPDNTFQVFNPLAWGNIYGSQFKSLGGPFAALGLGMIFGITSFIGYGGSAPLGEEAKRTRDIRKALVMGVLVVGVVLTEVAYSLTVGWGVNNMVSFATNGIPGIIVYTEYMGIIGGLLLALFAFNSAFSDSVAMQSNAGRVYFAMARDGVIPKFFSYVSKRFITPTKSLAFVGITSTVIAIATGFVVGYFSGLTPVQMFTLSATSNEVVNALENAFDYLTTIALVGLVIAHVMMNTSVTVLFRRLKEVHRGLNVIAHPIQHYVLPTVATLIFAFVLYESVYPPVFPVTQAVITGFAFLAFSVLYTIWIAKKRPHIMNKVGTRINLVREEQLEGNTKKDSGE
ncbi:APC family permease [Metallosphaera tengchongensis]|uniref:APC family permease n=2 Tax=Metallosphaera tengchongensis TaxID=1532350 RepID=A0A6N0P0J2_9CREN|nr:APC family permease [Metallosphaera tengchongensis]